MWTRTLIIVAGRQSFGFQNVVDPIHAYAAKAVTEQLDQNENLVSVNADVCNFWEKDVMPMLFCRSCSFFKKNFSRNRMLYRNIELAVDRVQKVGFVVGISFQGLGWLQDQLPAYHGV